MPIFDARIERFDSSEGWKMEKGNWYIVLKPEDIINFIERLVNTIRRGEIIIRIFPDGKGYIR